MREFLREHPPLVGFGAAVLVVLTVFLGADLFSVLVGRHAHIPPSPLRAPAGSPSPQADAAAQAVQDLEVVMRRNAPSPAASPQAGTSAGAAVEGELAMGPVAGRPGLSLQGVMLGGGVGIAVLEVDGQSYTVGVGDSAAGYTVAEILQDQVVLKRGGEVITVGLAGSAGGVQVSGEGPPVLPPPDAVPPPPAPAPAAGGAPVLPPPVADTAPPVAAAPAPAPAADMTRAEINAFVDQGAALALEVRGEMYVGAGDQSGVRLKFRKPDNALAKLGLKDGDVVMSMNGEPIRSPEELYNSYLILKNTPSVEFRILRDGKPDTVHYDFAE